MTAGPEAQREGSGQDGQGGPDFIGLVGFETVERGEGYARSELEVGPQHLNPYGALHGGVLYSMADTGMGAVIAPTLGEGETTATVEIKIVYLAAVTSGRIVCTTRLIQRGRRMAALESELHNVSDRGERLVAKALGTFAVFERRA